MGREGLGLTTLCPLFGPTAQSDPGPGGLFSGDAGNQLLERQKRLLFVAPIVPLCLWILNSSTKSIGFQAPLQLNNLTSVLEYVYWGVRLCPGLPCGGEKGPVALVPRMSTPP